MTDPTWQAITAAEYIHLAQQGTLGETLSDPDGHFGTPRMSTTWNDTSGRPLVRHQCWPVGHTVGFARPCLYERRVDQP